MIGPDSTAAPATLGYSIEELLARPFLDFVHPDDLAATKPLDVSQVLRLLDDTPTMGAQPR